MFHKTATNAQVNALKKCAITKEELLSYEEKIVNREFKNLNAKLWFQTATLHIDNLHKIEHNLLQKINQLNPRVLCLIRIIPIRCPFIPNIHPRIIGWARNLWKIWA